MTQTSVKSSDNTFICLACHSHNKIAADTTTLEGNASFINESTQQRLNLVFSQTCLNETVDMTKEAAKSAELEDIAKFLLSYDDNYIITYSSKLNIITEFGTAHE